MDVRVLVLLCLLTAVRSADNKPDISTEGMTLKCTGGTFDGEESIQMSYESSGEYKCKSDSCDNDDTCPKAVVKILSSEHLIQLEMKSVLGVLLGNVIATGLIGWAVYIVCSQPTTRSSYQGNKASDRQALINNHAPSGDTYQPLNTRSDEYSTLHAQRKHKNKQSV